jgi:predicted double-glycine peptidase
MIDVPLFYQEMEYSCGPASARMALGYFGMNMTEVEIRMKMGNCYNGNYINELADFFHSLNFELRCILEHDTPTSAIKTLEEEILNSVPVLVLLSTSLRDMPQKRTGRRYGPREYHFCVITGIEDNLIKMNDPAYGKVSMPDYQFLKRWYNHRIKGEMLSVWK